MPENDRLGNDDLRVTQDLEIDRVCMRFEEALKTDRQPSIEQFLGEVATPLRSVALRELLLLELEHVARSGNKPDAIQYLSRFPNDHAIVCGVFAKHAGPTELAKTEVPTPAKDDPLSSTTDSTSSLSDSSHHGRFLPGTKLAGRYRIVSLLGKGGMGEVYRADDMRLGQTVALKFLPKELESDPQRLEHFYNEVRLARQVTHPNVCRVYDIGDVDGQSYISMEYVDGEDLRSLLHRIGQLPKQKGIELARQLCAGLAAAHDKGVLHRDLKPANVMIDGHGKVRITDFGLAQLWSDNDQAITGTPAYMAPEQLARGETSIQSDLYALGLILYELFTGERVHKSNSMAQLREEHADSSSTKPPSEVVDDMDAAVDRVIMRCLETRPQGRPQAAVVVAASLPGGDPLAAALAAGETPSPELVAASGEAGWLSPVVAGSCLAALAVILSILVLFSGRYNSVARAPLDKDPAVLKDRAKEIIRHLGYDEQPADTAFGFQTEKDELDYISQQELPQGMRDRWELLTTTPWTGITFWYRESPVPLFANSFWTLRNFNWGQVGYWEPWWHTPGMVGVRLHPQGGLRSFQALPAVADIVDSEQTTGDVKWSKWFPKDYIGFDLDELSPATWRQTPRYVFDRWQAWEGTWPGSDQPLYVMAAAYQGKPVYFEIVHPTRGPHQAEKNEEASAQSGAFGARLRELVTNLNLSVLFLLAVQTGAVLLAIRNVRLGRGDRRGARRLATFVFVASMVVWLLLANHTNGLLEWGAFSIGLATALYYSAVFHWLFYIAIEPLVRREWPELLFSWARLLDGRWQDPRVGRDLLAGALFGALVVAAELARAACGIEMNSLGRYAAVGLLPGSRYVIAATLILITSAVSNGMAATVLLLLARSLVRNRVLAASLLVVVLTIYISLQSGLPLSGWVFNLFRIALFVWVAVRFGFLSSIVALFTSTVLAIHPITADNSAFYFGNGMLIIAMVAAVGLYGWYTCVGPPRTGERGT